MRDSLSDSDKPYVGNKSGKLRARTAECWQGEPLTESLIRADQMAQWVKQLSDN